MGKQVNNNTDSDKTKSNGKCNRSNKRRTTRTRGTRKTVDEMRNKSKNGENDVSWYTSSPSLVKAAGSFPFSNNIGTQINTSWSYINKNYSSTAVPGIITFPYVPVIGGASEANSPVNIAMRSLYTYVRHVNSGHANYDAPDLMLYVLAMDAAYSHYAHVVRAYGLLRTYSAVNRYLPKALLENIGFDYDNLYGQMANLNYWLNSYAYKLGALCVPGSMSYVTRHFWLNSNVYTDAPDLKAQLYAFYPSCYYVYDEMNGPGKLTKKSYPTKMTLDDIMRIGNEILDPILASEDLNIMSGDVLKAFGADKVIKISPISEAYTVQPMYNEEVLIQIENALVFPSHLIDIPDITQNSDVNGGYLLQPITGSMGITDSATHLIESLGVIPDKHIINMHYPDVSPEMMMIATRLHPHVFVTPGSPSQIARFSMGAVGSEVLMPARLVYMSNTSALYSRIHFTSSMVMNTDPDATTSTPEYIVTLLTKLSAFNRRPIMYLGKWVTYDIDPNGGLDVDFLGFNVDFDNYTLVDYGELYNMHQTALLSEFIVPQMGFMS